MLSHSWELERFWFSQHFEDYKFLRDNKCKNLGIVFRFYSRSKIEFYLLYVFNYSGESYCLPTLTREYPLTITNAPFYLLYLHFPVFWDTFLTNYAFTWAVYNHRIFQYIQTYHAIKVIQLYFHIDTCHIADVSHDNRCSTC